MHALITFIDSAPLWTLVMAALVPMLPFLAGEVRWLYRRDRATALFSLLVAAESAHCLDQIARLLTSDAAPTLGADLDGVHLAWHALVVVATGVLFVRFRANSWLGVSLLLAVAVAILGVESSTGLSDMLLTAPLVLAFLRHLEMLGEQENLSTPGRADE